MTLKKFLANTHIAERIDLSAGHILDAKGVHKFGAVPAMSVNTTGTVWDISDTVYPWSAFDTPGVLTVPAVNASDNGDKLTVYGLDANYNEISEQFTLSSSATVTGTKVFSRVFRAYFANSTTNVGNIDVQRGGTTVLRITAGKGQTLMAVYTIPAGYTGYLMKGVMSLQAGADATGDMFVRYFGQQSFRVGHSFEVTGGSPYGYDFTVPPMIPEKSDIDVRVNVRSNNARATAAFDLILVKN